MGLDGKSRSHVKLEGLLSTFGRRAYRFYTSLVPPRVPRGVQVMNPYTEPAVRRCLRLFLDRFYGDDDDRTLILGINPGRFGAGITGVTFTDPVALADLCGIPNDLPRRRELSSVFIYDAIAAFGGPERFYRRFFLSAISPLGYTRAGKNLNYYDGADLLRATTPFIVRALRRQIALGARRDHAVILGMGENLRFIRRLNEEHGFFGEIHGLEHPRFIMQYRRRRCPEYVERYTTLLARVDAGSPDET